LLRHIADGDPVTVPSRTAKEIGINRTTLVRLLSTLEDEGMIERRRDGAGYSLGPGIRQMCARALFSADVLQIADPVLADLTAALSLSSHLAVLDGKSVVYLLRRVPNLRLVSNVQIGTRLDAYSVNVGRIILAYMPENLVRTIFAGVDFTTVTEQTPKTVDALVVQLKRDRKLGLAWSDSNFEIGVSSVAAAVFDQLGRPIGAINVTGATSAFDRTPGRRQEIGAEVAQAATRISQQMGYVVSSEPPQGIPR
jgi:DNA-binding IclR family transcriptional regulator